MRQELGLYAAARRAKVKPRTIIDWIADGELKATWYHGAGWHVTERELDRVARAHCP